jgi:hypothetical protein
VPLPGAGDGEFLGLRVTTAEAVAVFDASAEDAEAVRVNWLTVLAGAVSWAWTSTCCPALSPPTEQSDVPLVAQTEKVGLSELGDVVSVILALPLVPLVSQTQMAYPTVVPGSTALTLLRVCTVRQSVPVGGVGVLVGVEVGVLVGVGVAVVVGVASGPPGLGGFPVPCWAGPGAGSAGMGEEETAGTGCGSVLGLGLVFPADGGDGALPVGPGVA